MFALANARCLVLVLREFEQDLGRHRSFLMPHLQLGVLGFDLFWLGIVEKLTGEYGNASGF